MCFHIAHSNVCRNLFIVNIANFNNNLNGKFPIFQRFIPLDLRECQLEFVGIKSAKKLLLHNL